MPIQPDPYPLHWIFVRIRIFGPSESDLLPCSAHFKFISVEFKLFFYLSLIRSPANKSFGKMLGMDFSTEKGQWKVMQGAEADGRRASEQAHKVNIRVNVCFFLSVVGTYLPSHPYPSYLFENMFPLEVRTVP
jgi:hypothetical protein